MSVPWPIERCVLCLRTPDADDAQTWVTNAHIIPASLGGRLSVRFLCRRCNSLIGAEIEGPLLADPSIRHCVEAVADRLPSRLLADMRERQRWFAQTELGPIEAAGTSAGALKPLESETFRREEHARAEMVAMWRRQGLSDAETAQYLKELDEAEPGAVLRLPGFTVRPRVDLESLEFRLPYDEPLVPETLPLAIAFLYLSLYLGKTAYEADALGPVREALLQNDAGPSEHWHVDPRRDARGCAPEHRLAMKETQPVVVHVQLFQARVWWVTFAKVGLTKAPPADYGIDVATGEEFLW